MTGTEPPRLRRTVPPHPTEAVDRRTRAALCAVAAVVAVSAFAALTWASARMEDAGSSYASMQLSGSDLPGVLEVLSGVHRWVLVAALADVAFAAAFGATLVLGLGLLADRVAHSDRHDAASFARSAGFAVGAWAALGYAAADLVENHLVLGALWRAAQGSSVGVLGEWIAGIGVVKYGLLIAAVVVPAVSWAVIGRVARQQFSSSAW
jgi:hypothetical protein